MMERFIEEFYTDKNKLQASLQALPVNSMAVIAAELMANLGPLSDFDADTEGMVRELYTDIINIGSLKVNEPSDFLEIVNWWYKTYNSREWYQQVIAAQMGTSGR